MLELRQDAGSFRSTHYVIIPQADGSTHWILTGTVHIPENLTPMDAHSGVSIFVIIPGIGSDAVQLSQWAPFVTVNGVTQGKPSATPVVIENFQLRDPHQLMRCAIVDCPNALRDLPAGQRLVSLGYVVHLVGHTVKVPMPE